MLEILLIAYMEPNTVPGNNSFVAGFLQCTSCSHPALCRTSPCVGQFPPECAFGPLVSIVGMPTNAILLLLSERW